MVSDPLFKPASMMQKMTESKGNSNKEENQENTVLHHTDDSCHFFIRVPEN